MGLDGSGTACGGMSGNGSGPSATGAKNGNAFSMWVRAGGLETYPPLAGRWPPTADHDHDRDHDHDYDQDQDHDHEHNHNIHDDYDDRDY